MSRRLAATPWAVLFVGAAAGAVPAPAAAQIPPGEDLLLTRAERSDFRETTRYDEVMDLVERLAAASPQIHLTTYGYTMEGRALPLLVIGAPDASPESVLATGHTRIYLQGNIHAGEVDGKEALLILLRRLASGEYAAWTDSLVLLVAPIYNADGNERVRLDNRPRQNGPVGGMGQRPNAQGLDLNRDHTKLDSPEARALAGLLNAYDPHVAVDLHTTNGTRHAYHLTYAPPLHPNTPAAIGGFLRNRWLPEVTARVREKHGWDFSFFGDAERTPDGGQGWTTFDHRPRFNNNYLGLRNRMAILGETYAYATFQDRVKAALWFVEEILDFAQQNAGTIRQIVEAADRESVVGRELALRAEPRRSGDVTILMGEVDEERNPYTGALMLRRRDVRIPTPMADYGTFGPSETAVAPQAYYVLPEAAAALERLEAHGVTVVRYAEARAVDAERFVVDSSKVAEREFQGHRERTVWGHWAAARVVLPEGAAYVSLDQPLGRLAFTLLEPRSDDGFTAWGFLDPEIEAGAFPVMRAPAVRR
ncbi:MAG: M14 family metallopeptidase [Longimicrobiales bacterium]|nr:M14 family metallopeptidase [Longimicrobiales bacterium]